MLTSDFVLSETPFNGLSLYKNIICQVAHNIATGLIHSLVIFDLRVLMMLRNMRTYFVLDPAFILRCRIINTYFL